MPQIDAKSILEQIKKHPLLTPKHCDNCGHPHQDEDISLVNASQAGVVFQSSCSACGLVQIFKMSPGGPLSIQRFETNNSDVSGPELQKFAGKPTVAKEEALDVYEDMQDVENIDDFLELLVDADKAD